VKFICDVHIPIKLVKFLNEAAYESIHVNKLPNKVFSTDSEIASVADSKGMIRITKNANFKNSFILNTKPKKAYKINLGNTSNEQLLSVFSQRTEPIKKLNQNDPFMFELGGNHETFTL